MRSRNAVWLSLLFVLALALACSSGEPPDSAPTLRPPAAVQEVVVTQLVEREVAVSGEVVEVTRVVGEGIEVYGDGATHSQPAFSSPPDDRPLPPPAATPDAMFFEDSGVNPYTLTIDDNLSTFAIDVDTGSYTLMRSYLDDYGQLPPPEAVRVEEFVNYFDQQYAQPDAGAFAIYLDGAPAPFADHPDYRLVRVGIQGERPPIEARPPLLLIFVIDTSGSMDREDRLGLVKASLGLLVDALREDDRVGIIEYGSEARSVLSPTAVRDRRTLLAAIDRLQPGGSTNAEDGIRQAYRMANRYRLTDETARLIVLSDGVANVGRTTSDEILSYARQGVSLSTFGFGMGNYNDALMEQLANDGDGTYAYVDTLREAERLFVTNLSSTLITIARDAKIQVEFNPQVVVQYRLLGYENRDVADAQFRDDTVDAGEIGAGHSVTALYELRLAEDAPAEAAALTVRLRYQSPDTGAVIELARSLAPAAFATDFAEAAPTLQLSAVVAEYAELLRDSYYARDGSLTAVYALARTVARQFPRDAAVAEFVDLVGMAADY